MTTGPYTADEHPIRYSDIFPARVDPLPVGVPSGQRVRVVATERFLTILWQGGAGPDGPLIGRVDFEFDPSEIGGDYYSGHAGQFSFTKIGGCGCGANALKSFKPFPGITFTEANRTGRVTSAVYGVPSPRYARTR